MFIFPVQLTTSRISNLTRLIHTLLYVMTIYTPEHTSSEHKGTHYSLIIAYEGMMVNYDSGVDKTTVGMHDATTEGSCCTLLLTLLVL